MLQPKDIDWLTGYKNNTCIYAIYKKPLQIQRYIQTESKGMENGNQKKARAAINISDKIDFKMKTVTRDWKDTK